MLHVVVLGATGLTGSGLVGQLLNDERFEKVTVFVRRSAGFSHPKLIEHIIDFSRPDTWHDKVRGDVIYLALGTTRAKAGSKAAQYLVDHTFQFQFARAASDNDVPALVLVSSAGANISSPYFYMRMKAALERDIRTIPFRQLVFIRPGALTGPHKQKRAGEAIGVGILRLLNKMGLFRKFRPVQAEIVARAMVNATFENQPGTQIYELEKVFEMAGQSGQ